jgi:dienelactone hydrolase
MMTLNIDRPDALIDVPRTITASGLAAGKAQLTTLFIHPDGSQWQSQVVFNIGVDGLLNLATDTPLVGDWQTPDAMAPVWSLRQVTVSQLELAEESLEPRHIQLTLVDALGQSASETLTQRYLAHGVRRERVQDRALSATLFTPAGPGPHPLVIVLNGSGGGTPEQRAALFAAHGYTGLALGYFKASGRPDFISATPLEYFEQAIIWAQTSLQPRDGFIALAGHSRGGELALLLASLLPEQVSAVIGYVPSAVLHGTLRAGRPDEGRDATAWTWRGEALRNIWQGNPHADWHAFDHPPTPGAAIRQAPAFVNVERHEASRAAARIAVERIAGPAILISGTDDGFWPSVDYCAQIDADLRAAGHLWPVEPVHNEGAGHAIGFPSVPTTDIAKIHPVAGVAINGGGTPQANARANEKSWLRVLAMLEAACQEWH